MPGWVVQLGQLLLSLSLLVFLHEWGHYITARMFKTRVEKFYLFFDFLFPFPNIGKFSLFKFKRGDTEWGIGWFPLGGYVKIAGMMDESADKEAMKLPPKPDEFRSKKSWQRLIIILGGIIVNLILGVLILWMVKFHWGDKYIPLDKVTMAITDSTLRSAGFRSGDKILGYTSLTDFKLDVLLDGKMDVRVEREGKEMQLTIPRGMIRALVKNPSAFFSPRIPLIVGEVPLDSKNYNSGLSVDDRIIQLDTIPIQYYDEYVLLSENYKGKKVPIKVQRGSKVVDLNVEISDKGLLGIKTIDADSLVSRGFIPVVHITYGFGEAFGSAINEACTKIVMYVKQFKLIFDPSTGAYKQVGGFAGMAKTFPDVWDWESFWRTTAFFSLVLAFMNFLPIPMLDGGYMMFILWEMIRGKPPGEKFMNVANTIGFVIVISLLVFANGNDILKLFTGG
jgi:regulator of sigma E protease